MMNRTLLFYFSIIILSISNCFNQSNRITESKVDFCVDARKDSFFFPHNQISFTRIVEKTKFGKTDLDFVQKYKDELEIIETLYSRRELAVAKSKAEELLKKGSEASSIRELYGRILYAFYRGKTTEKLKFAFPVYENLLKDLDQSGVEDAGSDHHPKSIIYHDHIDTYWKIGTLYLDRAEYANGSLEIQRAVVAHLHTTKNTNLNQRFLDEAYGFLTEAFFFLKDLKNNNFYYCKAKINNPNNTYVDKYKL